MSRLVTPARRARTSLTLTSSFLTRCPQSSSTSLVPEMEASFAFKRSTMSKSTSVSRPDTRTATGMSTGGPSPMRLTVVRRSGKRPLQKASSLAINASRIQGEVVWKSIKAYSGLPPFGPSPRDQDGGPPPTKDDHLETPSGREELAWSSPATNRSISATTRSVRSIGVPRGNSKSAAKRASSVGGKKMAGMKPNPCIATKKTATTAARVTHGRRSSDNRNSRYRR